MSFGLGKRLLLSVGLNRLLSLNEAADYDECLARRGVGAFQAGFWKKCRERFAKNCRERNGKKVKAVCLGQSSRGYGWECLYESSIGHPVCWMCIP